MVLVVVVFAVNICGEEEDASQKKDCISKIYFLSSEEETDGPPKQ
jgi:hypothetical protein